MYRTQVTTRRSLGAYNKEDIFMKAKRTAALGLAAVMAASLLSGCGAGGSKSAKTEITIYQSKIEANEGYKKAIAAYEESHPDVKINLEAAEETAAQIRLRNISGIVIIDFINLEREEDQKTVMEHLRRCVREDSVPVQVVDMTRLNLVELTRKKVEKSLAEQLTE